MFLNHCATLPPFLFSSLKFLTLCLDLTDDTPFFKIKLGPLQGNGHFLYGSLIGWLIDISWRVWPHVSGIRKNCNLSFSVAVQDSAIGGFGTQQSEAGTCAATKDHRPWKEERGNDFWRLACTCVGVQGREPQARRALGPGCWSLQPVDPVSRGPYGDWPAIPQLPPCSPGDSPASDAPPPHNVCWNADAWAHWTTVIMSRRMVSRLPGKLYTPRFENHWWIPLTLQKTA